MVSQIPLDYLHLVCLGVMRRMLQLWIRGPKNIRLSAEDVNVISKYLLSIKSCIPLEFSRKPRDLYDVDRWKGTEFRQFLLYTGIVILKPFISPKYFNHFLSFSIAIRILIDSQLCSTFNAYAKSLLFWFVSNYGKLYGDEYLSYNVHNLLHIADDGQKFGSLDNFSCFKYENHMQKIKNKLHKSGKPLEELSNRVFEELQIPIRSCYMIQYPKPFYTNNNNEISYIQFKTFTLSKKKNNNSALLYNNDVISISNIFEDNHVLYVRAQRFLNKKSLFTIPCASEKLGIFVVCNTSDSIEIPVAQIKMKCLKIKYFNESNSYVVIPLLTTNNDATCLL